LLDDVLDWSPGDFFCAYCSPSLSRIKPWNDESSTTSRVVAPCAGKRFVACTIGTIQHHSPLLSRIPEGLVMHQQQNSLSFAKTQAIE